MINVHTQLRHTVVSSNLTSLSLPVKTLVYIPVCFYRLNNWELEIFNLVTWFNDDFNFMWGDELVKTNYNWINGRLQSCYCDAVSRNKTVACHFISTYMLISTAFIMNTLICWTQCNSLDSIHCSTAESIRQGQTYNSDTNVNSVDHQSGSQLPPPPQYVTLLTEWSSSMNWNKVNRFRLLKFRTAIITIHNKITLLNNNQNNEQLHRVRKLRKKKKTADRSPNCFRLWRNTYSLAYWSTA